ncbi:MAG: alpha-2-macroglobulin family protein [Planctomycetota bacterium]
MLRAIEKAPLSEFRRAASFRQLLRNLLESGSLAGGELKDPWGQPLVLRQTWDGPEWSSHRGFSGPESRSWSEHELWHGLPAELRHLVQLVGSAIREGENLEHLDVDAAFDPDGFNDVIGIGRVAGGTLSGRRGLRRRAGAQTAHCSILTIPTRYDFRPTLCFVPERIVGASGRTRLRVPLADSLTTWRMRLVASDARGGIGVTETHLRVTQSLSIDPWVCRMLTLGDRLELPVALRNGTDKVLDVVAGIDPAPALGVDQAREIHLGVPVHASSAHRFRLKATKTGVARLRVHASAGALADAVAREVRIRPDGRRVETSKAGGLEQGRTWRVAWQVEPGSRGPARLSLRLFPSVLAETQQGFEGLLREPHGCFEQTSSTLYPMVLALRYMKRTGQLVSEIADRARQHVASGYRRLMSYEVQVSGGFELYGRAPAHTMLTAYGLHEFSDMADVYPVEPELIPRILGFLRGRQEQDGSFPAARLGGGSSAQADRLPTTAYVAWALARSGERPERALAWIEKHLDEIDSDHARGLAAMAFLSVDRKSSIGTALADTLARRVTHAGPRAFWTSDTRTCVGARGRSANIETTAIAIRVLLSSGRHLELVEPALAWLVAAGTRGFSCRPPCRMDPRCP